MSRLAALEARSQEARLVVNAVRTDKGSRLTRKQMERGGPGYSSEFRRIMTLPRRPAGVHDEPLRVAMTGWLRLPAHYTKGCPYCGRHVWTKPEPMSAGEHVYYCDPREYPIELRDSQARGIAEAIDNKGALLQLPVGAGKTLLGILLATAFKRELGIDNTALLVPSKLVAPFKRAIGRARRHWLVPSNLESFVVGYGRLSIAGNEDLLTNMAVGAIVCDEAHSLRQRSSARTRRFLRVFKEYPGTRLVGLSGSFIKSGPMDYWHLAKIALGEDRMPLPKSWPEMQDWAHVVKYRDDRDEDPPSPGCLGDLGAPGDTPAQAFARRVFETPGVVSTNQASVDASIRCNVISPALPKVLQDAITSVLNDWEIPGGHVIVDGNGMHRAVSQLSLGFYSKLTFPEDVDKDGWYEARRNWSKFCRRAYGMHSLKLDAELPVINAIRDGILPDPEGVFAKWSRFRETKPIDNVIWLDRDHAANVARHWLGNEGGLIWSHWVPAGERVAEALGLTYYGGGTDPEADAPFKSAVLSVAAHHEGRNLQFTHRSLCLTVSPKSAVNQQWIGRQHRQGQRADTVHFTFYAPTDLAKAKVTEARADAKWLAIQSNEPQKLDLADWEE